MVNWRECWSGNTSGRAPPRRPPTGREFLAVFVENSNKTLLMFEFDLYMSKDSEILNVACHDF